MSIKAKYYKHTLNFRFDAGTSRGVLKNKDTFFVVLYDENNPEIYGIGESAPINGLSIETSENTELYLTKLIFEINNGLINENELLKSIMIQSFPSVYFAFETALLDLKNGGKKMIFSNDFFHKKKPITINGLVWMAEKEIMAKQIKEKIEAGFSTIKIKVGAINFEDELELLKNIRLHFDNSKITIRIDANGAFENKNALEKLKRLSDFDIHSIEQPIKQGNWDFLADLCLKSPIPIALDEELIANFDKKQLVLDEINPQFIVLKPTLLGGFAETNEWIELAIEKNINWWITSALESNIGLNAISQFCANYNNTLPQGLGTGQIYENNLTSPLILEKDTIIYDENTTKWNLDFMN